MGDFLQTQKQRFLYTGPAGSGKTHALVQEFSALLRERMRELDPPVFYLVPTQEHLKRIHFLILEQSGLSAYAGRWVMTLNDFMRLKLAGAGLSWLEEDERLGLIRNILEQNRSRWRWFRYTDIPVGMLQRMADGIATLRSAFLTPEEFRRRSHELVSRNPSVEAKYADLNLIYEMYGSELERRDLTDWEGAVAQWSRDEIFRFESDWVIVDGFYHWTEPQKRFLARIKERTKRMCVALTCEPAGHRESLFSYPHALRTHLLSEGFVEKRFSKPHRFNSRDLARFENHLFKNVAPSGVPRVSSIEVLENASLRQEVESIFDEAEFLRKTRGFRWSDFMAVFREVKPYLGVLKELAQSRGIPITVHERLFLSDHESGRRIGRWLNLFAEEEARTEEQAGYLHRLFIKRHEDWMLSEEDRSVPGSAKKLRAALKHPRVQAWLKEEGGGVSIADGTIDASVVKSFAELQALKRRYRQITRPAAWREFLLEFCGEPSQASASAQRALKTLIDRVLANARSAEAFSVLEANERLRGFVERELFSDQDGAPDTFQIYDTSLILQKEYPVVFVAGLSDGQFPRYGLSDPVLHEEERQILNEGSILFDTRERRLSGEKFFFYVAVTRAQQRLYLSYAHQDGQGRPQEASPFVDEAQKCFGYSIPVRVRTASDIRLRQDGGRFEPDGAAEETGRSRSRLEAVYANPEPVFSASELKALYQCSYRHFAEYVLRLREEEPESEAWEDGIFIHEALREFFSLKAPPWETCESWFESRPPVLLGPVLSPARKAYRLFRLKRYFLNAVQCARDEEDATDVDERRVEWAFGLKPTDATPLKLRVGDVSVFLKGKVDRVDVRNRESEPEAHIIDYKRGQEFNRNDLRRGRDLQLPVYYWAVRDLLKLNVSRVSHVSYAQGTLKSLEGEELQSVMDEALASLADLEKRFRQAELTPRPRHCRLCSNFGLCRYPDWDSKR